MDSTAAFGDLLAATRSDIATEIATARQIVVDARRHVTRLGPTPRAWYLAGLAAQLERELLALDAVQGLT